MHHGQFWSTLANIHPLSTQNMKNWLKKSKTDKNWAVEEVRPVQDGFDITIANVISSKKTVYSKSFWQISRPYNFNWRPFIFHMIAWFVGLQIIVIP